MFLSFVLVVLVASGLPWSSTAEKARSLPSRPTFMSRSITAVRLASVHSHVPSSKNGHCATSLASVKVKTKIIPVEKRSASGRRYNNSGFYYGIREDMMGLPAPRENGEVPSLSPSASKAPAVKSFRSGVAKSGRPPLRKNSAALTEIMGETLLELREMREEIFALREEMRLMKQQIWTGEGVEDEEDFEDEEGDLLSNQGSEAEDDEGIQISNQQGISGLMARRKRNKMFEKMGRDVENWADRLFSENGEGDEEAEGGAWKEVKCNRVVKQKFNPEGRIRCWMMWMGDSREEHARQDDGSKEYPCIKVVATVDAPIDHVCDFLSREEYMPDYNELVCAHRDLEEITPHSKITWSQCPQILFVKPRDFVTFCHHRWRRDGSLIIVNQAVEHDDAPAVHDDKGGKVCRAYAIRGANIISRDPDDPNKTRFCLLAHADPGGGLPQWACKSAVNAVVPIEPFKLMANIENLVKRVGAPPPRSSFATALPGRSSRPAGVSQMGYACFWPAGGGLREEAPQHGPLGQFEDEAEGEGGRLEPPSGEERDSPASELSTLQ